MADLTTKTILSVCATTKGRLPDLSFKNGQLIFVQDTQRIALDFGGKRKFYNQIEELNTEEERVALEEPVNGSFYFVINTAVLWTYQNKWIQLTTPPEEILFIGTDVMPELGSSRTLYISKTNKEIYVWDADTNQYITVANCNEYIVNNDIDILFS